MLSLCFPELILKLLLRRSQPVSLLLPDLVDLFDHLFLHLLPHSLLLLLDLPLHLSLLLLSRLNLLLLLLRLLLQFDQLASVVLLHGLHQPLHLLALRLRLRGAPTFDARTGETAVG